MEKAQEVAATAHEPFDGSVAPSDQGRPTGPHQEGCVQRVKAWREALKSGTLSRKRRWQLIAGVVAFYLVRDVLLYIVVPVLLWAGW